MPRLRLRDFRLSRGPRVLGICAENLPLCAQYVNGAQRRLIFAREAGDESWWGTWAEVQFSNVSLSNPYITCPREVARLEKLNICGCPTPIQNQFYEYLDFGNGRLPKTSCGATWLSCNRVAVSRNNAITFAEPSMSPFIVRVFANDPVDSEGSKRVLLQGKDDTDSVIYGLDFNKQIQGEFVTLTDPFVEAANHYSVLSGIQKDFTTGDVQIFAVDPTTGDQQLLLTMAPGETVAGYRRYYLNNLPTNCCSETGATANLTVTAIAKLEPIPVSVDTDYLVLQNLEAIIEECIAIRMSEMDNTDAQQLALVHHVNAIRMLNSEIGHYLGIQNPAVNFAPFGSARLERQGIGLQI
jgi:hypothetical protein